MTPGALLVAAALAAEPAGPAPAPLSADAWEALSALELHHARVGRVGPPVFAGAAALEVGAGLTAAFAFDRPALGVGLVAGGLVHGTTATLAFESDRRRSAAYAARLAAIDRTRPGAASALAEQWRLTAEREARASAFAVGANVGAVLAGGLLVAAGCGPIARDYTGYGCDPEVGIGIGSAGVVGAVYHAIRWRSAARLSADLAVVDSRIPTVLTRP